MALDSMRVGGGRCPPLVVGILILMCVLLTCNWWSVSTEKTELLLQIERLQAEIRISLEEREKCETSVANLEIRNRQFQDTVASVYVRENELKKDKENLTRSVALCNGELESMKNLGSTKDAALAALRIDKETINEQLNVKREEALKLSADLEKTKIELSNLNRTCNSKAAQVAQDVDRDISKDLTNNLEGLIDDNNADTAGEIDDEPSAVLEPSKHENPAPIKDSVYNLILKGSNITPKSSKH